MNSKARRVSLEDGISFSDDIILSSEGSEKEEDEGEASSSSFKRMRRTSAQNESTISTSTQNNTSTTSLKRRRRVSLEQSALPAKRIKMSTIAVQTDLSWLNHTPPQYLFPAEQPLLATKTTRAQECRVHEQNFKTITPSPSLLSVPGMHFDNIDITAVPAADASNPKGSSGESTMDPLATGLDLEASLGASSASIEESSIPEELQDYLSVGIQSLSSARQEVVENLSSVPPATSSFVEYRPTLLENLQELHRGLLLARKVDVSCVSPAISFVECRPTFQENLQELQRGLFLALQVERNAPSPTEKIGFTAGQTSASTTAASLSVVLYDILLLTGTVLLALTVLQVWDLHSQYSNQLSFSDNDCIYVTGGGFSGFWFSLGRLHSLSREQMRQERFACYSAGCLGVVSVYTNYSMPQLFDMASGLQRDWNDGILNRYHVVEDFVDHLLKDQELEPDVLQSLYILTSVPKEDGSMVGFSAVMRQPTTMEELRLYLRQSTWIPLATGSGITLDGHLDGAFSVLQHPTCQKHVGLAKDWDLLTNTLNVNLGPDHVEQFWQMGLEYGIGE